MIDNSAFLAAPASPILCSCMIQDQALLAIWKVPVDSECMLEYTPDSLTDAQRENLWLNQTSNLKPHEARMQDSLSPFWLRVLI